MKQQDLLKIIDKPLLEHLYGFCYARTANHYESDELCSDILYAFVRAAQKAGEIASPQAFLWKIAHNVYADFSERRKKQSETTALFNPDVFPDDISGEDDAADEQEMRQQLMQIYRRIAFLGRAYREVMVAFYLEGKPVSEIAKTEHTSEGAVRQRLFSARAKIRKEVTAMTKNEIQKPMGLQPMHWIIWGTGNPLEGGVPTNECRRQISRHIVWLCRNHERTAKEISDLLNLPMLYVEEELELQVSGPKGYGMLRKLDNGKYINNVILFDREEITAAHNIFLDRIPALCDTICDYAQAHMEEYLSYPYLNRTVETNLVLWQMVHDYDTRVLRAVKDTLSEKYLADVPVSDPRPYTQYIYEEVPGAHVWGGGCDGVSVNEMCGYRKVHLTNLYNAALQAHFHCGHDVANDAALLLGIRALDGISVAGLSEDEQETAAKAIQNGYVSRDGDMLYTRFLCIPYDAYMTDEVFASNRALDEKIAPLADAIACDLAALFRRTLPAHLLGEYRFAGGLAAAPLTDSLVNALIARGLLTVPEDGIGAEGLWMAVQK